MKKRLVVIFLVLASGSVANRVYAQNATPQSIAGDWFARWDTAIGLMNTTYTFVSTGNALTGKVVMDINSSKSEVKMTDLKVEGDVVTFSYLYDDQLKFTYTGEIKGTEISFTRDAGGYAIEKAVARKVTTSK